MSCNIDERLHTIDDYDIAAIPENAPIAVKPKYQVGDLIRFLTPEELAQQGDIAKWVSERWDYAKLSFVVVEILLDIEAYRVYALGQDTFLIDIKLTDKKAILLCRANEE